MGCSSMHIAQEKLREVEAVCEVGAASEVETAYDNEEVGEVEAVCEEAVDSSSSCISS